MADTYYIPAADIDLALNAPNPACACGPPVVPLAFTVGNAPEDPAVYDFETDTSEYYSAPDSDRADLVPYVSESDDITSRMLYAEFTLVETTDISMWVKIASGAKVSKTFMSTPFDFGGVFVAAVIDTSTYEAAAQAVLGGYQDWQEVTLADIPPGSYMLQIVYADYPAAMFGDPAWPAPGEGETATDQCWVDDVTLDPPLYGVATITLTAYPPVSTEIRSIPAGDIALAMLTPGYFTGKATSIPAGGLTLAANVPDIIARAQVGAGETTEAITEWENIGDPLFIQWEELTSEYHSAPSCIYRPLTIEYSYDGIEFSGTWDQSGYLRFWLRLWGGDAEYWNSFTLFEMVDETPVEIYSWDRRLDTEYHEYKFAVSAGAHTFRIIAIQETGAVTPGASLRAWLDDIEAWWVDAGEVTTITLAGHKPVAYWNVPRSLVASATVIYTCTLTGDGDGLDDVTLPISSFQARMRDGAPSYVSCVVPNAALYESVITARANGDIVIKKGVRLPGGSLQLEEIARGNYDSVRIDQGPLSSSATMVGYKTVTSSAPKSWPVSNIEYRSVQASGARRYRGGINLFLRPGDTAIVGSESIVVDTITYSVDPLRAVMEILEAT